MTTAIIGVGNIGKVVARHLVQGGERVVLAARDESNARALANQLGELASATSVEKAIADADTVVFAVGFDTMKDLVVQHANLLAGKVVVDPSNPVAPDNSGGMARTLPDGQSSGSVIAGLLPAPNPAKPTEGNRRIKESHARAFGDYVREQSEWVAPPLVLRAPEIFAFEVRESIGGTAGRIENPVLSRRGSCSLDRFSKQRRKP